MESNCGLSLVCLFVYAEQSAPKLALNLTCAPIKSGRKLSCRSRPTLAAPQAPADCAGLAEQPVAGIDFNLRVNCWPSSAVWAKSIGQRRRVIFCASISWPSARSLLLLRATSCVCVCVRKLLVLTGKLAFATLAASWLASEAVGQLVSHSLSHSFVRSVAYLPERLTS